MWNWGDGGRAQRRSRCVRDHIRERRNKQAEGREAGRKAQDSGSSSPPLPDLTHRGLGDWSCQLFPLPYLPEGAMVPEAWTRGQRAASSLWGSFPPFFTKLAFSSRASGLSLDWAQLGWWGSHLFSPWCLPGPPFPATSDGAAAAGTILLCCLSSLVSPTPSGPCNCGLRQRLRGLGLG